MEERQSVIGALVGEEPTPIPLEVQIQFLERRVRAYEATEKSNAIAIRHQVVQQVYARDPEGMLEAKKVIEIADDLVGYILYGA